MVGQAQAEGCISDKEIQQYFQVSIKKPFKFRCFVNMLLFTPQELTQCAEDPQLDVLTFLQQPVERIQTYQTLLKVSSQLPSDTLIFRQEYEFKCLFLFYRSSSRTKPKVG